jgi:hypothetical protein
MAILEDGSDLDGKRLSAYIALVESRPIALALQLAYLLFAFAVGANGAIWPELFFDESVGGFFIVKTGIG